MKFITTALLLSILPVYLFCQQLLNSSNDDRRQNIQIAEPNEQVISKAAWDAQKNHLEVTENFTGSSGGPFEFLTGFKIENQSGKWIDRVYFHVSANVDATLGEQKAVVYLYQWNDNGDDLMEHHELRIVAKSDVKFSDGNASVAHLNIPVYNDLTGERGWEIPTNATRLFVGIRQLTEGFLFIGFDETTDLSLGNRQTGISALDAPHYWTIEWEDNLPFYLHSFSDFTAAPSIGLVINNEPPKSTALSAQNDAIEIYPNPANGYISVHVGDNQATEVLQYTVYNTLGINVYNSSLSQPSATPYQINTEKFAPGLYLLHVTGAHAKNVVPFVVQR